MITIEELTNKASRNFFKICTAYLKDESVFPYSVPFNKQTQGTAYADWKNHVIPLMQASKEQKGKGFSIDWKQKRVSGGLQKVPARIYFESLEDYLFYVNRKKDFEKITGNFKKIANLFPQLREWIRHHPEELLEYDSQWNDLSKVLSFMLMGKDLSGYYLRELPVEVHSKFIEQHIAILRKLLDLLLPEERINTNETDFAGRYGLKRANIYTQIRILDDALRPHLGYDDCALSLEDAAWLKWTPAKVFIIENLACFLSFPKVADAVAIFGQGFKSRLSMQLNWLAGSELYCWFDLDAAGFEMLNMIRAHYPGAKSLMMDSETFNAFHGFSVVSPGRRRELPLLNAAERALYLDLVQGEKRLEQEKISQRYVVASVLRI